MGKSEVQVFLVTQDGRGEYGGKESTYVQDSPWGMQAASGSTHGSFCRQSVRNELEGKPLKVNKKFHLLSEKIRGIEPARHHPIGLGDSGE